jgi:uncharacterized protein YcfJ
VSYQERWRLAIALKRAAPGPYDVGDVMVAEPATTPAAPKTTSTTSWVDVVMTFRDAWDHGKTFIVSGTALGLILGGLVGFGIGKGRK